MERLPAYYWNGANKEFFKSLNGKTATDCTQKGVHGFIQMQRAVVVVEVQRRSCKLCLPKVGIHVESGIEL